MVILNGYQMISSNDYKEFTLNFHFDKAEK